MLVEDLGRPGYASIGVTASGALDRPALMLANRLLGNRAGDAALEILLGPARITALAPHWVAVTGATGALVAGGRPAPVNAAFLLEEGDTLELGAAEYGVRYYLGVRGGVDVHPLLGSRSADVLSGFGSAVSAGEVLPVGSVLGPVDLAPVAASAPSLETVVFRVTPGPRLDWFGSLDALLAGPWTVSPASNRVGLRLSGPSLGRLVDRELPSEGMVTGALQVPPSGEPILFLADHPVTGGYPVIAVVDSGDLHLAAQLRPGQGVRFVGRGV